VRNVRKTVILSILLSSALLHLTITGWAEFLKKHRGHVIMFHGLMPEI